MHTDGDRLQEHAPTPDCFDTAPHAVVIPHPRRHTFSSGAFSVTLATENLDTTVYCENDDTPICAIYGKKRVRRQCTTQSTHEMEDILAFAAESHCLIRHDALALSYSDCVINSRFYCTWREYTAR